jgi:heptaprenyl diphosphate synthase
MAGYMVEKNILGNLSKTQVTVLTSLILAVALVLAVVENMLPPPPIPVPGVKFGLSNIAVMYALFFLGWEKAYVIALLKGGFAFITRGAVAGALSLAGGMLSVTVMLLLLVLLREKISYLSISIFGAVSHNIGQFFVIILLYTGMNLLPYLPILLVSGVIAGIVTSTLLRFILPAFKRLA